MIYNLINQNGYLIKQFENMKQCKKYIKEQHIKNYMILKTD